MHKIISFFLVFLFFACKKDKPPIKASAEIDKLITDYVKLGLVIGQYDSDFVDAYYGPDSLKPIGNADDMMPMDSLLKAVSDLKQQFQLVVDSSPNDTIKHRAMWVSQQLTAFGRRIKIFGGEYGTFDEESKDLFGVVAPTFTEEYFKGHVGKLDQLLPGKGDVAARFQALSNRFVIPKEKLDTVFKTAIAECRARTSQHLTLPQQEDFDLEYVTDKPWSGYNWYKGNYKSVIQVNTDLPILIDRVIDVGSHESYPGHHVYNMMLEKNLFHDNGYLEVSLYPLYSPQSLIAEGSANYGIEVVLPGKDKVDFARTVLLPLAGIDTTGIGLYFKAQELKAPLSYVRNEVGRGILNDTMTEAEALRWMQDYGLYSEASAKKGISFIKRNRTYIINYNYGMDLVKKYIESHGGAASEAKRWELFEWLLSHEITPAELM